LKKEASEGKARRKRIHYAISQLVSWFLFTLVFGFRCFGRNRIPKQGGCIIACSHQSFLDPIIIGFSSSRAVNYLARSSLFKNRVFAALIRSYGATELERDQADVKALKACVEQLRRGEIVLLFPEGTRTRTGEIAPLKPGVFLMSARAGVPVVPAAVEGSLRSWPRGRLPLRIAYGRPLYASGGGASYREMAVKLRERMKELQARIRKIR
jgi:1-acyl-sn-glycerol-3-phosphate acyltransferase